MTETFSPSEQVQTIVQLYQDSVARGGIEANPAQREIAERFDALRCKLIRDPRPKGNLLTRLLTPQASSTGLYLWGGVGTGKTFLMDMFFSSLPFEDKTRIHFYRFMKQTHEALKKHAGTANPLRRVAREWGRANRVICFDEFLVNDIADAMLLGELLINLFQQGVCLVMTSNVVPDKLYENGLQRSRFLPAIDMLNMHTQVIEIGNATDYRRRSLLQADIFHYPLSETGDKKLLESLGKLTCPENLQADRKIEINGRPVHARFATGDAAWFTFSELCGTARSQLDYIEIATCYSVVLLSDVPRLQASNDDAARRFISLIDELYDRNVKLIMSSETPPEEIYSGSRLSFEFERTRSRLNEMQSAEFLSRCHNTAADSLV